VRSGRRKVRLYNVYGLLDGSVERIVEGMEISRGGAILLCLRQSGW